MRFLYLWINSSAVADAGVLQKAMGHRKPHQHQPRATRDHTKKAQQIKSKF